MPRAPAAARRPANTTSSPTFSAPTASLKSSPLDPETKPGSQKSSQDHDNLDYSRDFEDLLDDHPHPKPLKEPTSSVSQQLSMPLRDDQGDILLKTSVSNGSVPSPRTGILRLPSSVLTLPIANLPLGSKIPSSEPVSLPFLPSTSIPHASQAKLTHNSDEPSIGTQLKSNRAFLPPTQTATTTSMTSPLAKDPSSLNPYDDKSCNGDVNIDSITGKLPSSAPVATPVYQLPLITLSIATTSQSAPNKPPTFGKDNATSVAVEEGNVYSDDDFEESALPSYRSTTTKSQHDEKVDLPAPSQVTVPTDIGTDDGEIDINSPLLKNPSTSPLITKITLLPEASLPFQSFATSSTPPKRLSTSTTSTISTTSTPHSDVKPRPPSNVPTSSSSNSTSAFNRASTPSLPKSTTKPTPAKSSVQSPAPTSVPKPSIPFSSSKSSPFTDLPSSTGDVIIDAPSLQTPSTTPLIGTVLKLQEAPDGITPLHPSSTAKLSSATSTTKAPSKTHLPSSLSSTSTPLPHRSNRVTSTPNPALSATMPNLPAKPKSITTSTTIKPQSLVATRNTTTASSSSSLYQIGIASHLMSESSNKESGDINTSSSFSSIPSTQPQSGPITHLPQPPAPSTLHPPLPKTSTSTPSSNVIRNKSNLSTNHLGVHGSTTRPSTKPITPSAVAKSAIADIPASSLADTLPSKPKPTHQIRPGSATSSTTKEVRKKTTAVSSSASSAHAAPSQTIPASTNVSPFIPPDDIANEQKRTIIKAVFALLSRIHITISQAAALLTKPITTSSTTPLSSSTSPSHPLLSSSTSTTISSSVSQAASLVQQIRSANARPSSSSSQQDPSIPATLSQIAQMISAVDALVLDDTPSTSSSGYINANESSKESLSDIRQYPDWLQPEMDKVVSRLKTLIQLERMCAVHSTSPPVSLTSSAPGNNPTTTTSFDGHTPSIEDIRTLKENIDEIGFGSIHNLQMHSKGVETPPFGPSTHSQTGNSTALSRGIKASVPMATMPIQSANTVKPWNPAGAPPRELATITKSPTTPKRPRSATSTSKPPVLSATSPANSVSSSLPLSSHRDVTFNQTGLTSEPPLQSSLQSQHHSAPTQIIVPSTGNDALAAAITALAQSQTDTRRDAFFHRAEQVLERVTKEREWDRQREWEMSKEREREKEDIIRTRDRQLTDQMKAQQEQLLSLSQQLANAQNHLQTLTQQQIHHLQFQQQQQQQQQQLQPQGMGSQEAVSILLQNQQMQTSLLTAILAQTVGANVAHSHNPQSNAPKLPLYSSLPLGNPFSLPTSSSYAAVPSASTIVSTSRTPTPVTPAVSSSHRGVMIRPDLLQQRAAVNSLPITTPPLSISQQLQDQQQTHQSLPSRISTPLGKETSAKNSPAFSSSNNSAPPSSILAQGTASNNNSNVGNNFAPRILSCKHPELDLLGRPVKVPYDALGLNSKQGLLEELKQLGDVSQIRYSAFVDQPSTLRNGLYAGGALMGIGNKTMRMLVVTDTHIHTVSEIFGATIGHADPNDINTRTHQVHSSMHLAHIGVVTIPSSSTFAFMLHRVVDPVNTFDDQSSIVSSSTILISMARRGEALAAISTAIKRLPGLSSGLKYEYVSREVFATMSGG